MSAKTAAARAAVTPSMLARMPEGVQSQLAIYISARGATDKAMLHIVNFYVTNGQGLALGLS